MIPPPECQELERCIALLANILSVNWQVRERITYFLGSPDISKLAKDFAANLEKRKVDLGFNLFALISDVYHRENFHSDILRAFLDPAGKHGAGDTYLRLFLNFLQEQGARIRTEDYSRAEVVREQGRVDLLIRDWTSKRAIIVENKINDAGDMPRQIPRYLQYVRSQGLSCDAVIYLRLSTKAYPDTDDWNSEEKADVEKLLIPAVAYDETDRDLLNGWLRKCHIAAERGSSAAHILSQYAELITHLGGTVMNEPLMQEFHAKMLEPETFRTALSVRSMLDALPEYRRNRILDAFRDKYSPFRKLWPNKTRAAVFSDLPYEEADLSLDVEADSDDTYRVLFWDRNHDGENAWVMRVLQKIEFLEEFHWNDGAYVKRFDFPSQEAALYGFIQEFKTRLSNVLNQKRCA